MPRRPVRGRTWDYECDWEGCESPSPSGAKHAPPVLASRLRRSPSPPPALASRLRRSLSAARPRERLQGALARRWRRHARSDAVPIATASRPFPPSPHRAFWTAWPATRVSDPRLRCETDYIGVAMQYYREPFYSYPVQLAARAALGARHMPRKEAERAHWRVATRLAASAKAGVRGAAAALPRRLRALVGWMRASPPPHSSPSRGGTRISRATPSRYRPGSWYQTEVSPPPAAPSPDTAASLGAARTGIPLS